MDTTVLIVIVIALLVAGAVGLYLYSTRQKSTRLRERFGPEYERMSRETGQREAEKELAERERRVQKLRIVELSAQDREVFAAEWQRVQAHFVDDPGDAIDEADGLVQRVMDRRGYPMTDFEQQAADISADHPEVVSNYREAHEIAEAHERGNASTEDLRQAMIHYRALFADLLGADGSNAGPQSRQEARR